MSKMDEALDKMFSKNEVQSKPIIREKPLPSPKVSIDFDTSYIDFSKIANSSEFKRFIYFIRVGTTFRGSNAKLDIELKKSEEKINIVKDLNKGNFRDVMNEFKEKLEVLNK